MNAQPREVTQTVEQLERLLGERLESVYRFGTPFARGLAGPRIRLLVLVRAIDGPLLDEMLGLVGQARDRRVGLRLDTARDVLHSADVLPIFALELIETRALIWGEDALAELKVRTDDLIAGVEHGLRGIHRDLLVGYLESRGDSDLNLLLRRQLRRLSYLLRAAGMVQDVPLPAANEGGVIRAMSAHLLPGADPEVWHQLVRFARFEFQPDHPQLVALFGDLLDGVSALVEVVDTLNQPRS